MTWRSIGWGVAFLVVTVFAIPWFLWRDGSTALGLPIWLWWHIGWMILTSVVFAVFADRGWGLWVETGEAGREAR